MLWVYQHSAAYDWCKNPLVQRDLSSPYRAISAFYIRTCIRSGHTQPSSGAPRNSILLLYIRQFNYKVPQCGTLNNFHKYPWFLSYTKKNILKIFFWIFLYNVEIDFVMRLLHYYFVWFSNLTKIYLSLILERNYSGKISNDERVHIRNR